jgi:hypothetical protein
MISLETATLSINLKTKQGIIIDQHVKEVKNVECQTIINEVNFSEAEIRAVEQKIQFYSNDGSAVRSINDFLTGDFMDGTVLACDVILEFLEGFRAQGVLDLSKFQDTIIVKTYKHSRVFGLVLNSLHARNYIEKTQPGGSDARKAIVAGTHFSSAFGIDMGLSSALRWLFRRSVVVIPKMARVALVVARWAPIVPFVMVSPPQVKACTDGFGNLRSVSTLRQRGGLDL